MRLLKIFIAVCILMFNGAAGAAELIQNSEFSDPVLADSDWILRPTGNSWEFIGNSGIYNPTTVQYPGMDYSNVGFANAGGMIQQNLMRTLELGDVFTLSMDVGARADNDFGGYSAKLVVDGSIIPFALSAVPSSGEFISITAQVFIDGAHQQLIDSGKNVYLELSNPSSTSASKQTHFDNVSLDMVNNVGSLSNVSIGFLNDGDVTNLNLPDTQININYQSDLLALELSSFQLLLNGENITSQCTTYPEYANCQLVGIAKGEHLLVASISDVTQNSATSSLNFYIDNAPGASADLKLLGGLIDENDNAFIITDKLGMLSITRAKVDELFNYTSVVASNSTVTSSHQERVAHNHWEYTYCTSLDYSETVPAPFQPIGYAGAGCDGQGQNNNSRIYTYIDFYDNVGNYYGQYSHSTDRSFFSTACAVISYSTLLIDDYSWSAGTHTSGMGDCFIFTVNDRVYTYVDFPESELPMLRYYIHRPATPFSEETYNLGHFMLTDEQGTIHKHAMQDTSRAVEYLTDIVFK